MVDATDNKMAPGRYCYKDMLPFVAMVSMECINVGLNTLFKAATLTGMSYHVFVVYSYAVAALVLLPSPFFCNRSRGLPPLNFSIQSKIFLLGLTGCTSQIMGYTGINYSSPTLASAVSNLVPAFTFILAILFRFCLFPPFSPSFFFFFFFAPYYLHATNFCLFVTSIVLIYESNLTL